MFRSLLPVARRRGGLRNVACPGRVSMHGFWRNSRYSPPRRLMHKHTDTQTLMHERSRLDTHTQIYTNIHNIYRVAASRTDSKSHA